MKRTIFTNNFCAELQQCIDAVAPDHVYVLTDSTTHELCLPLLERLEGFEAMHRITIAAGDDNKNLDTLAHIWQELSHNHATRKSLMLNLGGGMVTDIGGFAASTFKRGIRYINIPTTLLATIDAATGGKTGINFCGLKNEIGVINPAEYVLVNVDFLRTLSHDNLLSGFAEMLKHALLSGSEAWSELLAFDLEAFSLAQLKPLLQASLEVKEQIVAQDPKEQHLRKALNLGHTIGHAFESLSHTLHTPALHGYAVAWGMLCELYLAHIKLQFPQQPLLALRDIIKEHYGFMPITCKQYDALFALMQHDKKNVGDNINFTLLSDIGTVALDQTATKEELYEVLDFYQEIAS